MSHHRANVNWIIPDETVSVDQAILAVLMDIRAELRLIRERVHPLQHLNCLRFIGIPRVLERIANNTRRPARRPTPSKASHATYHRKTRKKTRL